MELTIYQQTPHYVVCEKPHGVESEKQMPHLLCAQLGLSVLYTVHRLDKETAGVMVYAKTKEAAARFSQQIQQGDFEKTYLAVVKGTPDPTAGTFTDLLFRDRQKNKSYVVKRMRKGVKEAVLSYETLESVSVEGIPHSLVKIRLQTGRTHQIRVQFSSRNLPLLGDKKYGGCPHPHLCLVAHRLAFTDRDGTRREFTSEKEINKNELTTSFS